MLEYSSNLTIIYSKLYMVLNSYLLEKSSKSYFQGGVLEIPAKVVSFIIIFLIAFPYGFVFGVMFCIPMKITPCKILRQLIIF